MDCSNALEITIDMHGNNASTSALCVKAACRDQIFAQETSAVPSNPGCPTRIIVLAEAHPAIPAG
jgi:hypothetical protein